MEIDRIVMYDVFKGKSDGVPNGMSTKSKRILIQIIKVKGIKSNNL